jgi:chromosome segregation ATPase
MEPELLIISQVLALQRQDSQRLDKIFQLEMEVAQASEQVSLLQRQESQHLDKIAQLETEAAQMSEAHQRALDEIQRVREELGSLQQVAQQTIGCKFRCVVMHCLCAVGCDQ